MKALSSTLLAAQKSRSSRPFVRARLRDFYGDSPRVRFQRWYAGTEDAAPTACGGAADGSLVRARNDAGTLYVSRVAAPDAQSDYSSWSEIESVFSGTGPALVRMPDDELWLFYVETNHTTVELSVSTDHGASWGLGTAVVTAGGDKDHLAAAVNPSGDVVLFWSEGATVYTSRWNGTAWGARTAWSHTVHSVTGVTARHDGDFQVVVAGSEDATEHPKVWWARYGDGFAQAADTWGALRAFTEASAGSDVAFSVPAVELFDSTWRLLFVESFDGDAPYARVQYATKPQLTDFDTDQWREALPFDYEGNGFGVSACVIGPDLLVLAAADAVWGGARLADLDVSGDVVDAAVESGPDGAVARLELDNSGGRYNGYGSGEVAVVQRGARLELSPGYVTAAGGEVTTGRPYAYWVEAIERTTGPRPRLVLRCRGGDGLLRRWRARRQYVFPPGEFAVSALLFVVASRAGLAFSTTGNVSAAIDLLEPAFTVHPGESGLTAARRLAAKVPDVLFFDGGALFATEPRPDDTSQYAFGPEAHEIVEARYRDAGPGVNRARAVGDGVLGEAFDFADIEASGELLRDAVDANLDDSDDAEERAEALLRKAAIASRSDELTVFGVHCGVELWDVVDVTDPQAGLSEAPRRVLGYAWRYSTAPRPRYEMTLTLGEV